MNNYDKATLIVSMLLKRGWLDFDVQEEYEECVDDIANTLNRQDSLTQLTEQAQEDG